MIITSFKSLSEMYGELCVRFRELVKLRDENLHDWKSIKYSDELEKVDRALKIIEELQKIEV